MGPSQESLSVFVTGATGHVGHAVARALRRAGHEVFHLTRSEAKANLLTRGRLGRRVGDINRPGSSAAAEAARSVVIHAVADMEIRDLFASLA